jgi:hypothetical protein
LQLSWRYIEAFEVKAAKLNAQPMNIEPVRHFGDALLEVDAASGDPTARHRRAQTSGIVNYGHPHRRLPRSPVPGGLIYCRAT